MCDSGMEAHELVSGPPLPGSVPGCESDSGSPAKMPSNPNSLPQRSLRAMEPLPSIQTRHTRDEEEGEAEVQGEDNGGASEARNGHDELEAACLHRATHRPEPDLLGYFGTNRAGSGGVGCRKSVGGDQ